VATNSLSPLSRPARFYTSLVVATGTAILGLSVASLISVPPAAGWLVLAGLALLSGAFNIKVPGIPTQLWLFFAVLSGMMVFAQGPLLSIASTHLDRRIVLAVGMAFLALALISYQRSATVCRGRRSRLGLRNSAAASKAWCRTRSPAPAVLRASPDSSSEVVSTRRWAATCSSSRPTSLRSSWC